MDRDFIARHWYASVYEQFENQTHDVAFLLQVLAKRTAGPQNILEVACGGGRICVPLAQAGHRVTGFDADEHMLLNCYRRMAGLPNIRCYRGDAAKTEWGNGFDVVVLAGNILINIESDLDYAVAQAEFIRRAGAALRPGGHLYLDFDLPYDPAAYFNSLGESRYFEGTDDLGTAGHTAGYGSVYDPVTQLCAGVSHLDLTTNGGERLVIVQRWYKHIPTQEQVYGWIAAAGLTLERSYQNYTDEPVPRPLEPKSQRAILWARKE